MPHTQKETITVFVVIEAPESTAAETDAACEAWAALLEGEGTPDQQSAR